MSVLCDSWMVVGAKGMLGVDLVRHLRDSGIETVALDSEEVDICDRDSVAAALDEYNPRVVINVAAMTDVDGCEDRIEDAYRVNAHGPRNLASAASTRGTFLVHVSTDYVFDGKGKKPHREDDPIGPIGVYGASKAQGELFVREALPDDHCIVRTQWLFGIHGKNFVETILNGARTRDVLRVVNDQCGRPSYAPDVARALAQLSRVRGRGTFHVANSGETTWYNFARAIVERAGLSHIRVEPISTEELGRPAPRPAYSVLDTSRFSALAGYTPRHWTAALDEYLRIRREAAGSDGPGA